MNLKFESLKLSEYDQNYLTNITIPRYVIETRKKAVEIWFEVFKEYSGRLGYKVVAVEDYRPETHQLLTVGNGEMLLQHTQNSIQSQRLNGLCSLNTSRYNDYVVAKLLELGYTLSIKDKVLNIKWELQNAK